MEQNKPAGLAAASLVMGILSLVLSCLPVVPSITSLLGVIFGGVALNQVKKGIGGGNGMAVAGLVMSLIYLILEVVCIILVVVVGLAPLASLPFLSYLAEY